MFSVNKDMTAHYTGTLNGKYQYRIGRYTVTIDPETEEEFGVTYRDSGRSSTFPEIKVEDDQIVLNLWDLAQKALEQCDPLSVAASVWDNPLVREELLRLMLDGWFNSDVASIRLSDEVAAEVLNRLQQTVLGDRVSALAERIRGVEYYERKYWALYHAGLSGPTERPDWLPDFAVSSEDGKTRVHMREDPEYKIGSQNWHDARDWWRDKIAARLGLTHDIYETGDEDAPSVCKDRNGDVVLSLCRRCGKGEGDLGPWCV